MHVCVCVCVCVEGRKTNVKVVAVIQLYSYGDVGTSKTYRVVHVSNLVFRFRPQVYCELNKLAERH